MVPVNWFCDRILKIRFISSIALLLPVVAIAIYTWTYIAINRNKPVIRNTSNRTSWMLNAKQLNVTSITRSSPPAHCPWLLNMTQRRRNYVPTAVEPPWQTLLRNYSAASASGRNLYLWACNPQRKRRFGNQIFNFAAVFGVAWRNKRIPWWTEIYTQVAAFRHRLVIDMIRQRLVRNASYMHSMC